MEELTSGHPNIKGWGIDADPRNEPTAPIRKRVPTEHDGYRWPRPNQQTESVEVLHSNERPHLTAAFGTTSPPRGLSGLLRRFAFRYSESCYVHWLPLMLADRVDMVEGVADDLLHGHIPNIPDELGWSAEWKYNRASFLVRLALKAGLIFGLLALLKSRRRRW